MQGPHGAPRPGDLDDIANLDLTLAEAKRLLAGVQQEIVAAQAREHAVLRPDCSRCGVHRLPLRRIRNGAHPQAECSV